MPEQFDTASLPHDYSTVAEASEIMLPDIDAVEHQRAGWFTRRLRVSVAAGSMVLAAMGGTLTTSGSAMAGGLNDEVYSPTATFAEKAQDVTAMGHRGLKGYYKGRKADEDTVRSCLHAVASGADACEIDMRVTKDGVALGMHDENTNRVTRDCNLKISTHNYRRLKRCHMNHGDAISTVEQIAAALSPYRNRVDIIAEIKDKYISTKELRAINNSFVHYGFDSTNLAYESFNGRNLRRMKSVAPDVKALKIDGSAYPMRAGSLSAAFDGLIIPYSAFVNGEQANDQFAEEFRMRGLEIIPWGVETLAQMRNVVESGGSGFMSDHVDRVNSLRQ
jgi:glycerophosphoryl diester phosphodiesterase